MKKSTLYIFILSFLSGLASIIVFLSPSLPNSYKWLAILPAGYSVIMLLTSKIHVLAKRYLGIRILYIVMFLRYVVLPVLIALSGDVSGIGNGKLPTESLILPSALLMLWELIASILIITIIGNHVLLKKNIKVNINLKDNNDVNIVYSLVLITSLLLIIIYPSLLGNFQFFTVTEDGIRNVSYFNGIDIRLLLVAKVIIFCLVVNKLSNLYNRNKNSIYYYLSLIMSFLYIAIYRGDNRTNIVVDIICVSVVMYYSFPEERKKSLAFISSLGASLILIVSMYRIFAVTSWRPEGGSVELNLSFFTRLFQSYLSGPSNVAIAIDTSENFNDHITINTLFNDFFAWTGYFANWFKIDSFETTNYLFNMSYYQYSLLWSGYGDQIIPMVGQGYIYLGYIGAPLFSVLTCIMIIYIDKFRCKSDSVISLFISTFLVVRLSLFMGLNITILMMFILDRYLQLWLIEKANALIKIKWRKGVKQYDCKKMYPC